MGPQSAHAAQAAQATAAERFLGWPAALIAGAFVPAAWLLGDGATLLLYVGFNVVFNAPHQMGTWVRAAREPAHSAPGPLGPGRARFVVVAVVVLLLSLALHLGRPATNVLLIDALTYWGLWHLVSQHFGISQILRGRAGEGDRPWQRPRNRNWHRGYFLVLHVAGVVYLHAAASLTFTVGDDVTQLARLPLPMSARPAIAVVCVVVFVAAAVVRLWLAFRHNRRRFHYEASSTAVIAAAFFASPNVMITVVVLTCVHNIHYLALVRSTLARDGGPAPGPRHVVAAVVYSLAIHAAFLLAPAAGATIFAAAVATHYLVDGRLWRLRDNPRLARALGLSAR